MVFTLAYFKELGVFTFYDFLDIFRVVPWLDLIAKATGIAKKESRKIVVLYINTIICLRNSS